MGGYSGPSHKIPSSGKTDSRDFEKADSPFYGIECDFIQIIFLGLWEITFYESKSCHENRTTIA